MNPKDVYAVIMAGGSGTRFWPKSSKKKPKQLLNLTGKESLIKLTDKRLNPLISKNNRWVVCTELLKTATKKELKAAKILAEPEGRNTMAAVCWAAWTIHKLNPNSLLIVLPADAHVANNESYISTLQTALEVAQNQRKIVCVGIRPTFPATGYGYIESGENHKIKRFVEKPNEETAKQFLSSQKFLWNAGIFVFRSDVFINEARIHASEFAQAFDQILKSPRSLAKIYKGLAKVSVDVALMEKTQEGAVVPGDFGWNDVGSWTALPEVLSANTDAGLINSIGECLTIDSENLIVDATSNNLIGLIGVKDLIIVQTPKVLLVCHKDKAQKIKDLVARVEQTKKYKDLV